MDGGSQYRYPRVGQKLKWESVVRKGERKTCEDQLAVPQHLNHGYVAVCKISEIYN